MCIYHALRMLADGLSISVARRCGWPSTSAFIDVFRRAYGYTPGTNHQPN
jgi:AraC-like DNA-binding protein